MKLGIKRIISVMSVLALLGSAFPIQKVSAAEEAGIYYTPKGESGRYCNSIDEALQYCYQKGGTVIIKKDWELNFPKEVKYGLIESDTTLVVDYGATVTIGENGLRMDGILRIMGTVDLEHSEGILYGQGSIDILDGQLIKKSYQINQRDEKICLDAKDIIYGQTLSDAEIKEDQINWTTPVEGTWKFAKPEWMPQAGTKNHDIVFVPRYSMTYSESYFEQCGKVHVKQAAPQQKDFETVTLHVGESLQGVHPNVTYVSPINGKEVKGVFSFDQEDNEYTTAGKVKVRGTFVPEDDNYASVQEYIWIDIEPVKPEISVVPLVRNQGYYGQTLGQIQFVQGKCINPHTGKVISGTWEWKNGSERLQLGNKSYTMLFLPEAEGYETVELNVEVTTLPKVMEDIEWPSCSDLTYGERLADATLSFEKNEYGTFFWKDENFCPEVKNDGVQVVFRPADTDMYDWSSLAGYQQETNTIVFTIPICVKPREGQLPTVQASEVMEGTSVSGSALSISVANGTVEWQEPEQIATHSGWYPACFTPFDLDNFDWSCYNPDSQGRIPMKVYLNVKQNPLACTPTPDSAVLENGKKEESQTSPEQQKGTSPSEEVTTFVITQMVSKASNINVVEVKQTGFRKTKRKKNCVKLYWRKVKGVKYQIQYSSSEKWKKSKKKTVSKTSATIENLKGGKKYYFRIRCVLKKNGRNYYSKWSKKRKV